MQTIETAPKDGTDVLIWRDGWDAAPRAKWGEYPDNPVESGDGEEVHMSGWLFDEMISLGHEDGFLGWEDDPMPTHWMPLPQPPSTETE